MRMTLTACAALAAMMMTMSADAGSFIRPCPPDINCDGQVNVDDLLMLLSEWGPCEFGQDCPADLDGCGIVGVTDLLVLLAAWGECTFDYPALPENTEAWQVSLEMLGPGGPVVPPDEIFERVERDMDLIRRELPELEGVTHVPAWVNQIITSFEPDEPHPNVECLLAFYEGQVTNVLFGTMHVIQFPTIVNMEAISSAFAAAPETAWAEPDGLIGGDNFWVPTDLGGGVWHWWIDNGWHDCFDGCDCHIFYEIEIDADGNLTILDITQQGLPWCQWPS